jgi:[ribosomal protein S5]-alanine N-acetyltransferase
MTLTVPHPYEQGVAEEWIAGQEAAWSSGERLVLAVTTQADGLVGAIGLHFASEHQRAELGYWIGVPYWGRGYATEAAAALLSFAFGDLGLRRVVAHHFSRNPASGRVLQKLGMRHEGSLRDHVLKWGAFEDLEIYGILAGEWAGRG